MNLEEKVIDIISESLGVDPDEVSPDSHLTQDLNATDLEISDLMVKIGRQFEVTFSQEETEEVETVGQIIDLVADKIGEFT